MPIALLVDWSSRRSRSYISSSSAVRRRATYYAGVVASRNTAAISKRCSARFSGENERSEGPRSSTKAATTSRDERWAGSGCHCRRAADERRRRQPGIDPLSQSRRRRRQHRLQPARALDAGVATATRLFTIRLLVSVSTRRSDCSASFRGQPDGVAAPPAHRPRPRFDTTNAARPYDHQRRTSTATGRRWRCQIGRRRI